ncbi:MAG: hypothetical protein LC744_04780 [Chloroflexi bacterium]|nr:hypothetical protein [Acidobacteriota bacterium]MCA1587967.1 hypothetical protein [Chloroflexota bacterium]MCA1719554.1 hypothetical protein [Actinomycetota bacterium]
MDDEGIGWGTARGQARGVDGAPAPARHFQIPEPLPETSRDGIAELVSRAHDRTAGQCRLTPFANRLFDLQRRSGIAPEFVLLLASFLVLESMIKEFDTDVDFQAEPIPTLPAALNS